MQIRKEPTFTAQKLMIHGVSGSGKTTLASKVGKKALILDVENGASALSNVVDHSQLSDYESFYKVMSELFAQAKVGKLEYDNIVIDSIDELVRLIEAHQSGAAENKDMKATIYKGDGAYGNGKKFMENEIRLRLFKFIDLFIKYGVTITLVAHSNMKPLMDSEGNRIDTVAPKMDEYLMNLFVEHMDEVYYLKNVDGKRSLVLESDGVVLAKNRVGRHGEISLDDVDINTLLKPEGK